MENESYPNAESHANQEYREELNPKATIMIAPRDRPRKIVGGKLGRSPQVERASLCALVPRN